MISNNYLGVGVRAGKPSKRELTRTYFFLPEVLGNSSILSVPLFAGMIVVWNVAVRRSGIESGVTLLPCSTRLDK